jgi:DNA-binding NarL/FixJ family response regulator
MALWQPTVAPAQAHPTQAIYDPLTQAVIQHEPLPAVTSWWQEALDGTRPPLPILLSQAPDASPKTRSLADLDSLSQREREILTLLAEGLSNKHIAQRLIIAETTVKWYVKQIFLKLGVHNRTQAVARWHQT